jgi:mannose/fructose-specific phosphotransferase system component IIA
MIGVIGVTHGQVANELVNAARTIVGYSWDLLGVAREMREIGRNAIASWNGATKVAPYRKR